MAAAASGTGGWRAEKERADALFKRKLFFDAASAYELALRLLRAESEGRERDVSAEATILSNRAQALMKIGEFKAAEADCSAAIELEPQPKALFRRSHCRRELRNIDAAIADMERCLALATVEDMRCEAAKQLAALRDVEARSLLESRSAPGNVGERAAKLAALCVAAGAAARAGDMWFVLPVAWWEAWVASPDSAPTGPIEIEPLCVPADSKVDAASTSPRLLERAGYQGITSSMLRADIADVVQVEFGGSAGSAQTRIVARDGFWRRGGLRAARPVMIVPDAAFRLVDAWVGVRGVCRRPVIGTIDRSEGRRGVLCELRPRQVRVHLPVHLGREPLLLEASDTNSLQQLREEVAAMLVLSLTDLRLRGNKALLSDLALVADAARDSPDDALEIFAELRLPSGEWPESPGVPQQQASNGPAGPSLTSSEASGDSLQAVSKKPHAEKPPAVPSVERYCLACGRSAAQAGRKMLRCSRCKAATYCGMRCQRAHWVFHQERCGAASAVESQRAGRTGLRNLGFTCYLNSALQILSQTPEIARHLISDAYLEEINRDNVLGTKGELASLVARVLQSMWFGNRSAVDPSALVEGVSRWSQGRFVARTQHDSQEFVSFVLDGLHEDLNRVRQKPYAPLGDSRGRPDDEVAREHWQGHLLRNQSVVVDHFHGQFKSTLMCPQCENVSVTFDPFLTVSLPIPDATLRLVSVNLHEAAGGRPTRYFVPVSAKSTVQQLKESLCEMVREARGRSIAPGQLVVAEVVQARLARLLGGGKPMSALSVKAVLDVFETSCTSQSERAERGLVQLLVTFRAVCSPGADDKSSAPTADAFGWPLVIDVAADLSAGALRDLLWLRHVSRLFHGSSGSAAPAFVALRRDRGVASVAEGEALSLDAPLARQARDREQLAFDVPASFFAAAFDQHEAATVDVQRRSEAVEERKTRETTLDKCLKQFTLAETLDGTETWRCSACKQHVAPSKKMELWRLPDVLVIHLKRFKTVQSIFGLGGVRLDTPIDFPIVGLDLSEFLPPSALVGTARPVYDLFGVINHYGTLSNGHYTAAALASNESRSRGGAPVFNTDGACHWVLFDDSSVEAMDAARLDRQAAYVLFYRRRRGAA